MFKKLKARKLKNKLLKHTLLYLSLIVFLLDNRRMRRNSGKTIVLVFHHIDQPKRLESILHLAGRYYRLISFGDWLSGNKSKELVNVIFSFDDGYSSWQDALEILRRFRVRGCLFFVCSGFINDSYPDFCKKIGTWAEPALREADISSIVRDHYLGSHTDLHTSAATFDFADLEVLCSSDIKLMERYKQFTPRTMALVQGILPRAGRAQETSFDYIFSCLPGYLEENTQEYPILPRTNVGLRYSFLMIPVITGHYNAVLNTYLRITKILRKIHE